MGKFPLQLCTSLANTVLICESLQSHKLDPKRSKKNGWLRRLSNIWLCDNLLRSLQRKGFNKLINLSFVLSKGFQPSNPPYLLKQYPSPTTQSSPHLDFITLCLGASQHKCLFPWDLNGVSCESGCVGYVMLCQCWAYVFNICVYVYINKPRGFSKARAQGGVPSCPGLKVVPGQPSHPC